MRLARTAAIALIVSLLSSPAILPSNPLHAAGTEYYAILVGISDYLYQHDLTYPVVETTALYEQLATIWGTDHVTLITNDSATKSAVQYSIQNWLAPREDSDDVVLFYFDGHGGTDGSNYYIAPADSSLYTWSNDISDYELSNWLSGLDSSNVVVILDTCDSGGLVTDLASTSEVIMTSSAASESSWSSMFSHYLVQALDNSVTADNTADYTLTTQEIFTYTSPKVTQYVAQHWGESQHPVYYGSTIPFFLIAAIGSNVASGTVTLDGTQYADLLAPKYILITPSESHQIMAQSEIVNGTNSRYEFSSWNDGATSPTRTIYQGGQYTANYQTQYYFAVSAERGSVSGTGWYDSGTTASTDTAQEVINDGNTRYVFEHWDIDNIPSAGNPAPVSMYAPHTAYADYKTQYYLSVSTEHGTVSGTGWYDTGTVVRTGTAQDTITEGNTRYLFEHWDIDGVAETYNPATIQMYTPHAAVADYKTQYYLDVQSEYGNASGSGWYDSGTVASASVSPVVGTLIRHKFSGWNGDSGDGETTTGIYMDQSKTIVATWKTDCLYLYLLIGGIIFVAAVVTISVTMHIRNNRLSIRATNRRRLKMRA